MEDERKSFRDLKVWESETEYLLFLSQELNYIDPKLNKGLTAQVVEIKCMLTGLIQKLKADS